MNWIKRIWNKIFRKDNIDDYIQIIELKNTVSFDINKAFHNIRENGVMVYGRLFKESEDFSKVISEDGTEITREEFLNAISKELNSQYGDEVLKEVIKQIKEEK